MPVQTVQNKFRKYSFVFYSVLLFASAVFFLILSSKAVDIVESKMAFLGNQPQEKGKIQPNLEERKQVEIIDQKILPPNFGAGAILAEDVESGQLLYQKNIHMRLPPASTTKLMTALVAKDQFRAGEILTVPIQALVGGSSMGLNVNEELTFRSLLYGMLLNSGNDAAYTIAFNYPGGFEAFINKMNEKALELGLSDTHFQNPAGFDDSNHYSSAFDLGIIAKITTKDPYLSKIVATKETSILAFDKSKLHPLKNLNKLLSEDGVLGIKTGTTEKSGENFVGLVERNGHKVLTVVLASQDRFGETKQLMDWVYENFSWTTFGDTHQ